MKSIFDCCPTARQREDGCMRTYIFVRQQQMQCCSSKTKQSQSHSWSIWRKINLPKSIIQFKSEGEWQKERESAFCLHVNYNETVQWRQLVFTSLHTHRTVGHIDISIAHWIEHFLMLREEGREGEEMSCKKSGDNYKCLRHNLSIEERKHWRLADNCRRQLVGDMLSGTRAFHPLLLFSSYPTGDVDEDISTMSTFTITTTKRL